MAVRVQGAPPASQTDLSQFVVAAAEEFGMPGVAVGLWFYGRETYACDGVTSLENPLPVDRDTLFLLGSVTKTFTATALMCLVASGQVALDAPVPGRARCAGDALPARAQARGLRWARFHLGDGRAEDGTRVLPAELMAQMRTPTVPLRASTLGDAIGIGWFLLDVSGVGTAGHAAPPTASSLRFLPCPAGASPSRRLPTPVRTASPSIGPSCAGRLPPTWA